MARSLMWFTNNKFSTNWTRLLDGKAWLWQAAVVLAVKRWQLSNSWCPLSRQPSHDTLSVLGSRCDGLQFTTAFVLLCKTQVHHFHTATDTTVFYLFIYTYLQKQRCQWYFQIIKFKQHKERQQNIHCILIRMKLVLLLKKLKWCWIT